MTWGARLCGVVGGRHGIYEGEWEGLCRERCESEAAREVVRKHGAAAHQPVEVAFLLCCFVLRDAERLLSVKIGVVYGRSSRRCFFSCVFFFFVCVLLSPCLPLLTCACVCLCACPLSALSLCPRRVAFLPNPFLSLFRPRPSVQVSVACACVFMFAYWTRYTRVRLHCFPCAQPALLEQLPLPSVDVCRACKRRRYEQKAKVAFVCLSAALFLFY